MAASITSMLDSFASAFEQTTRLLKVNLASSSGIQENTLLPHRLTGIDAINQGFRYELEVLSSDTFIELKDLLGVPIEILVLTDAGREHEIAGIITAAHQESSDSGFAVYRLIVESGLSVLSLRHNARVCLEVDVFAVTKLVLSDHLEKNSVLKAAFSLDNRCKGKYPIRPFWMQYGESDESYLKRILFREGISFVLQPAEKSSSSHPQHQLILFDDVHDLDVNASHSVRFHRADGTEKHDAITQWNGHRKLQAGSVARMTWDHATASIHHAKETSMADQGESGNALSSTLENYQHHVPMEGEDLEHFPSLATRRMKALEGLMKRFEGESSVRTFQAGTWFSLTQHPIHDQDAPKDREFLITSLEVDAENNLPKDLTSNLSGLLGSKRQETSNPVPPYANRFSCVRRGIPVMADEIIPPDPGLITARVVGPKNEVVHTDKLGRTKIRFLFTREKDHKDAGATDTDADSAWVRQMETWGSQGFGASFQPRVDDEVCVQFLGGDPDKPVITGNVHNRTKMPTSFGDVSVLPNEKILSGIRSHMFYGTGGNELIFDDTTSQLRARLASDHDASHLNLGYLVHPRSKSKGMPRGEGFDLRTDAWGAVRAQNGLLITTYRTSGTHLEADPLTSQMESSLELSKVLSDTCDQMGADKLEANESLRYLKESAKAKKKQGRSGQEVPAFNAPVIGMASPDGIINATPASHVMSAGDNLHITSGEDTNIGVGKKLVIAIKESWSAFVAKSGIKLFAGKENFDIEAQDGNIQILADKDVKIVSVNGELKILAKKFIKVTAGQCQIELTENVVNLYMVGPLLIKGNLCCGGAPTGPPVLPFMPKGELENKVKKGNFQVRMHIDAHKGDKFTLKSLDGSYQQVKPVTDDMTTGDKFVDLEYTDLIPDKSYSLEVCYGKDGKTAFMFEDVPFTGLCHA